MLINFTNHPSANWTDKQTQLAGELYGEIVDIAFPLVPADADEESIKKMAEENFAKIKGTFLEKANNKENAVHIQGEFTLVYALVNKLKNAGIKCIASTSIREAYEKPDGTKVSVFRFVRFREY